MDGNDTHSRHRHAITFPALCRPVSFALANTSLLQIGTHDNHMRVAKPDHSPEIFDSVWQGALYREEAA